MLNQKVNNLYIDNFLNDYIEYHLKREKKKFSKLKFKTKNNNSKKISKIDSYNIINSENKEKLPYIDKKLFINIQSKDKTLTNNLNSIKIKKNILLNNNTNKNQISPTKEINNIFKEPLKIKNEEEINNINDLNKLHDSENENNFKENNNELNEYKIKRKPSIEKINPRMSIKKLSKNLKFELDKELIINEKSKSIKNITELKNIEQKENKNKLTKIKSEIKQKKEKEDEKIIDTLYIGNSIINNCKIKNKTIYDIRPLNKTKERASCHFPSEENDTKPNNNEIKLPMNNTINSISSKNIKKNTNYITQKNIKYFRNSYSQVYSINAANSNFNNNNNNDIAINIKINDDKEKENDSEKEKNKLIKYELSEQELINILNCNKEEKNINNDFNKKKQLSKSKAKNFITTKRDNKKNLEFIDLEILAKEISDKKQFKNNLHSFFAKEENVVRGERIKFLKTCYQVKFVKPLLSQHSYKFKTTNSTKKIFSPKRLKFPINHFNLDVLRDSNLKEINKTKKYLFWLKKDINLNLNNLVNHLEKDINYI